MNALKTYAPIVSRYLLGAIFFMAGIMGLLNLAPPPDNLPEDMKTFMAGMMVTKYFFPLLKLTETVCGALLLVRVAPALALIVLAPITINIFFTHAFLTPSPDQLMLPLLVVVLHVTAATAYWNKYRPLFSRR